MKIYISGPMTGLPEYNYPAFNAMEKNIAELGHWQIVNPARLPAQPTWREYMIQDIGELLKCSHVVMLRGWQHSKGASLEHHIAKALGLTILYEESICPISMSLLIRSWITSMKAGLKELSPWRHDDGGTRRDQVGHRSLRLRSPGIITDEPRPATRTSNLIKDRNLMEALASQLKGLVNIPCIEFSYNWNHKLECDSFTTLRLANSERYQKNVVYFVRSKDKDYGEFYIEDIRQITLAQINPFIARLDTGYDVAECVKLIKTMYKNKNINWDKQMLYLILLVKLKKATDE